MSFKVFGTPMAFSGSLPPVLLGVVQQETVGEYKHRYLIVNSYMSYK